MRDQWLRLLVDRIEELSRDNGRLEQDRNTLRAGLDRVRADKTMLQEAPAGYGGSATLRGHLSPDRAPRGTQWPARRRRWPVATGEQRRVRTEE